MRLDGLGLREEVALIKGSLVVVLEGGDERATMIRFGLEAVVETFSVFFFPNHDVGLPSGNRLDAVPERFLVSPGISFSVDNAVVQYERISFAEYVELVGRLALQLAHEKEIVQQHKMKSAYRKKTLKKETKNLEKIAETKHSATLHASLDMDRDMFLNELPLLLNKIHTYLTNVNDKGMNLGVIINVSTCTCVDSFFFSLFLYYSLFVNSYQ